MNPVFVWARAWMKGYEANWNVVKALFMIRFTEQADIREEMLTAANK